MSDNRIREAPGVRPPPVPSAARPDDRTALLPRQRPQNAHGGGVTVITPGSGSSAARIDDRPPQSVQGRTNTLGGRVQPGQRQG